MQRKKNTKEALIVWGLVIIAALAHNFIKF